MQDISQVSPNKTNSKKFFIPYVLIFLLIICVIALHSQIAKMQNSDSVRINLAGRQRMLTQKLSKEVLQYLNGMTQKEDLEQTIKVFNTTLHALLNGGNAPMDLNFQKYVQLPQMENSSTKRQLSKVIDLWQLFKTNIVAFINTKDTTALYYILQNNNKILDEMDKAVFMMQSTAEKNNRTINIILYITYFFIILIFTVLLVTKLYQLKHASVYIDRLENLLPICAKCKKIREPNAEPQRQESWTAIESYIGNRSTAKFSHGLCPACEEELYGDEEWFKERRKETSKQNQAETTPNDK